MSERIQNVHAQEYGGKKFRSTLEAETAKTLDALGIPYEYETRKLVLQEGFRCPFQKERVRDLTYTPDFILGNILLECKGFETPEWKIKKKLVFKYLLDKWPEAIFYQIHDCKKSLLEILDRHWLSFGYAVKITGKLSKKQAGLSCRYSSIREAMEHLNLTNKTIGPIIRSLTHKTDYVYGYKWELEKLKL